jgi:hypothetical protein
MSLMNITDPVLGTDGKFHVKRARVRYNTRKDGSIHEYTTIRDVTLTKLNAGRLKTITPEIVAKRKLIRSKVCKLDMNKLDELIAHMDGMII